MKKLLLPLAFLAVGSFASSIIGPPGGGGGGTGTVVGPSSADDLGIVLFDGTTGQLIKEATGTGVCKSSSGVFSVGTVSLSSEITGTLGVSHGGSGLTSLGTANQVLGVNSGASAAEYKSILGTTSQVVVTHGAGSITLSTPQSIATTSSPTFGGLTLTPLSTGPVVNTSGVLNSTTYATFTSNLSVFTGDSGSGGVKGLVPAPASGDAAASKFLKADGTWTTPSGSGDVSSNTSSSVDGELTLFNGTTGKSIKRASGTGVVVGTSGVASFQSYSTLTGNLSVFTGDSGSGGAKGLVPAPSAGDAAAGKVLSAGGSWIADNSTMTSVINWWGDGADSPEMGTNLGLKIWTFAVTADQALYGAISVPSNYISGSPITVRIRTYNTSGTSTMLLKATSTLIPAGTAITSTTNQRTTTNTATASSGVNVIREQDLDVSSSTGTINSVAIGAGDLILLKMFRGTDTSQDVVFVDSSTGVSFR